MKSKTPRMSALSAWKQQLSLLPYGIIAFVATVVGITLGLSLAIVGIGIPILAGTLAWNANRLAQEQRQWEAWREGGTAASAQLAGPEGEAAEERGSWGKWFRTIGTSAGYRGAGHNLLSFPLRIALFVVTLTVPLSAAALMLAPAAYKVSDYLYGYVLYNDQVMELLLPPLTPFQRSFVVAGIGFVLLLFVPALLRAGGRLYAGWIDVFAGSSLPALAAASLPAEAPAAAAPAGSTDDWLARAEAAISRFDEDAKQMQAPQPH